jgi:hypothetical protein
MMSYLIQNVGNCSYITLSRRTTLFYRYCSATFFFFPAKPNNIASPIRKFALSYVELE